MTAAVTGLFLLSDQGLEQSLDHGATWVAKQRPSPDDSCSGVTLVEDRQLLVVCQVKSPDKYGVFIGDVAAVAKSTENANLGGINPTGPAVKMRAGSPTPVTLATAPTAKVIATGARSWTRVDPGKAGKTYTAMWGPNGTELYVGIGFAGLGRSKDGGKTWTLESVAGQVATIWGTGKDVFLSGDSVRRSSNGGKTWTDVAVKAVTELKAKLGRKELEFRSLAGSGKQIYAVGDGGVLVRSENGGSTWKADGPNTSAQLFAVWARPDAVFVAGEGGLLWVSRDKGKTWIGQNIDTTVRWEAIWGTAKDVFVVGEKGVVLHGTGDREITWKQLAMPTIADVHAVWGTSAQDFYCLAFLEAWHTRDGGGSWVQEPVPSTNTSGIWGPSADEVYVVGFDMVMRGTPAP